LVKEYKLRVNDIYFGNCRCSNPRSETSYHIYLLIDMYQKSQGMASMIAVKFDTLASYRKFVLGGRK